jgi:N-methylhydantoinase A/oxoprolinase/acetone carboxylase beta subunit
MMGRAGLYRSTFWACTVVLAARLPVLPCAKAFRQNGGGRDCGISPIEVQIPKMQPTASRRTVRIAVDIGGTFTDIEILDEATGQTFAAKTPTTPDDPSEGLIAGLHMAGKEVGFDFGDISALLHGTTIATNAVLQRRLPKGALITTAGFEDVLEIGRHFRKQVYASKAEPRVVLVPRAWRLGIKERARADGTIETPLDEREAQRLAEKLKAGGIQCAAVCLLHAYANPEHEKRIAALLAKHAPDLDVSLSHEVSPEIREFERSSTTVLNALLMPVVRRYLERLRARLKNAGFEAPVYLVQSNGGVMSPETAALLPARLLLSGPSGGALAAETIAQRLAIPDVVAVDMGGTSYDVSIVSGGGTRLVTEGTVDGLPVRLPMIEIRTIGSGGGSIALVEESGRLRVGPESAGAKPGPACYSRGGTEPTVTDANVVLGRIDPQFFLGGAMHLDAEAARAAVAGSVAEKLALAPEAAAEGILQVAVSHMAGAIRLSLFEKGLDPEDFTLLSFGGASGLHACDTADEIGIGRVVFPRDPGTLSAWGMLYSDVVHALARARLMKADADALPVLAEICAKLRGTGAERLEGDGIARADQLLPIALDMRYPGQAYEIQVPFDASAKDPAAALAASIASFHEIHEAQYAHAEPHVTPEIVAIRIAATGTLRKPIEHAFAFTGSAAPKGRRPVYAAGRWHDAAIHERAKLAADIRISGPAIIEEAHATHFIPPRWELTTAPTGDLIATKRAGDAA